jgi:hypothetical protein
MTLALSVDHRTWAPLTPPVLLHVAASVTVLLFVKPLIVVLRGRLPAPLPQAATRMDFPASVAAKGALALVRVELPFAIAPSATVLESGFAL